MVQQSTLKGYISWIALTLYFVGFGIVSKAIQNVEFAGIPQDIVNTAAPWITLAAIGVVAASGWRGSTNRYEVWEGILVILIPFIVVAGYVPQVETLLSDFSVTLYYNWASWLLSSTIAWVLSRAN